MRTVIGFYKPERTREVVLRHRLSHWNNTFDSVRIMADGEETYYWEDPNENSSVENLNINPVRKGPPAQLGTFSAISDADFLSLYNSIPAGQLYDWICRLSDADDA